MKMQQQSASLTGFHQDIPMFDLTGKNLRKKNGVLILTYFIVRSLSDVRIFVFEFILIK